MASKKESSAPIRVVNAYIFYSRKRCAELKEEKRSGRVLGETIPNIIKKEWNEMSDEEKMPFREL